MIPQKTIDEVLEKADILEVVKGFVDLKKSGINFKGFSPFNQEKNPSFYVIPHKNIYKDFSSGKGGTVIAFLMEHQKFSFVEAVKYLAEKYKIQIPDAPEGSESENNNVDAFYLANKLAKDFFVSQLYRPENTLILEYLKGRFTDDEILEWQIGIATDEWTGLLDHLVNQGWEKQLLIDFNLVKKNEKNRVYDYFRNRIVFPIENPSGNICAFGARALPWELKKNDNLPKYLNSPDSTIYHKSKVLFGLSRARKEIIKKDMCHIVEGYPDLIAMHSSGLINTVAPCGTSLTEDHILLIKKFCKQINLVFDGDDPGYKAILPAAEKILKAGAAALVTRLPDGEDPGSFIKEDTASYIKDNHQFFLTWYASNQLAGTFEDPVARHKALKEITRLICLIPDRSMRDLIVDDLVKKFELKRKLLKEMIDNENPDQADVYDDDLPAEVDAREYQRWGFYSFKNEYYFRTKEGISRMSNFVMRPLFHIESATNSTRLYELTNYKGYKVVVQLNMQEMTSLQAFTKNVEGRGNFLYWGQAPQWSKLKERLYEETRSATEIKNLGWQKEGFWAWSNGIILQDGSFVPIDEYGIVEFENDSYFIPAFSKIYIKDKSIFEDERKFKFKTRDEFNIRNWTELFTRVYGNNGKIGIAFWIASVFRDHILKIFGNFPILNLFGPKGTGKSQMAIALCSLFGEGQKPFNIHNGTKAGFAEHVQLFINSIAIVDEYKNSIDYEKIETLKSIYDAIGRTRINLDKGNKKESTKVNSGVILLGQEMPTADVALFSRTIFLRFHKTVFSEEEKQNYQSLKDIQNVGLSNLTSILIRHREYFIKHFYSIYDSTLGDINQNFRVEGIEDRIMRNFASILAAFRTIENVINFPFTYNELLEIALECIMIQNNQINSSNEVSTFWDILEAMFDDNILIDGWHFKVQYTDSIRGKSKTIDFGPGGAKSILKFKFNSVIKLYSEHASRMKVKPLPADTLKYYLENHEAFIIVEKDCRFTLSEFSNVEGKVIEQKQITTAYCFDYSKLKINLTREAIMAKEDQIPIGYKIPYADNESYDIAAKANEDGIPW